MMKRIILSIALVFAMFVTVDAQKKSALTKIVESGELKVGTTGNQPPYSMTSLGGELVGYEVDLATLLAESMGLKLTLVQLPFDELLPALKAGKIDAVMSGMTITPERNMNALFVGPYMVSGKSILTKGSTLTAIDEQGEINQSTVKLAALKGSTSETFCATVLPEAEISLTQNYDEAVQMLLNDQVMAIIADVEICQVTMLRYPNEDLAALDTPLTIEPIGMAISPDAFLLENIINNYFASLQMIGALDLLQIKWFEDGSWLLQVK
jgi:polar amino acid transport system substrate-binding protein